MFDAIKVKNDCVQWIRDWFAENGPGCNAVVGISGGKDSSIVAALCVEALGKDRVVGVLMPQGVQSDIDDALALVKHLEIAHITVNIGGPVDSVLYEIRTGFTMDDSMPDNCTKQTLENLPPRIRMATLYAVSQSVNGRVANTCNLSEDWVGYSTRYGDSVGDFSPLSDLTVTECKAIGRSLGLPSEFVDKVPSDGLCGISDEERFGFTYDELDRYIRTGEIDDPEKKALIDGMHERNLFKLALMPKFEYKS